MVVVRLFFIVAILPLFIASYTKTIQRFLDSLNIMSVLSYYDFHSKEEYNYLERRYKYSQEEIEYIIGIELPELEYVEYEEEELNTHLLRGHKMTKKLEFIQIPQQSYYNRLDSLCDLDNERWTTEEYNSILDSLIKSNGMDWTEYLIGDRKEEMDSIAKQIMVINNIQPIHYKFSGDIKLYIEKGSKYATLKYS